MAEGFDPYHKWLGIPPAEQPPHHYRLLGIAVFESDPDVIEHAADRQMAHVRSLATGKYAQHTQKLLNELAAAKVCLLSSKEKAAYDAALRARLHAQEAAAHEQAAARAASVPLAMPPAGASGAVPAAFAQPLQTGVPQATPQAFTAEPDVQPALMPVIAASTSPAERLRRRQRASLFLWSCVGSVLLLAGAGVTLVMRNNQGPSTAELPPTHAGVPEGDQKSRLNAPPERQTTVPPRHTSVGSNPGTTPGTKPTDPSALNSPPEAESAEQQAVRTIGRLGGRVQRARGGGPVVGINLAGRSATGGEVLRLIGQLSDLRELGLNGAGVTDVDLAHLRSLSKLDKLHLGGTAISDAGLEHLQGLASLRELRIPFTRVTGVGLAFIARCKSLEVLDLTNADLRGGHMQQLAQLGGLRELILNRCPLDAQDVDALAALPALERLSLNRARVDEGSLAALADLRTLKYLDVRGIQLTQATLAALRNTIRNGRIEADPPSDLTRGRPPAGQQQPPKRAAVPDEAVVQRNVELVRGELFREEYAGAKNAAAKQQLAQRVLDKAEQTQDDAASRYVLLQEGRRLAAEAGALELLVRAVDALAEQFEVDGLALRAESLSAAAKNVSTPELRERLVALSLDAAESCVAESRYQGARELLNVARVAVNRLADAELKREVGARLRELDELEKLHAAAEQARQALQANPNDAEAHQQLGVFLCLVRGEWEQGLSNLAQGSDDVLRALAQQEKAQPADAEAQVALADAWYEFSRKSQGLLRTRAQERAVHWYRTALPPAAGLAKDKIERRLSELGGTQESSAGDALSQAARGAIVYLADLPEMNVQTADTHPLSKGQIRYYVHRFRPLRVKSTEVPHGLVLMPPANGFSTVSYRLAKRAVQFRAEVGIADGAYNVCESPLVFEVWGDGRLLARSTPIQNRGETLPVSVNVGRVEVLELRVVCQGGNQDAFAVWIEPHVLRK